MNVVESYSANLSSAISAIFSLNHRGGNVSKEILRKEKNVPLSVIVKDCQDPRYAYTVKKKSIVFI